MSVISLRGGALLYLFNLNVMFASFTLVFIPLNHRKTGFNYVGFVVLEPPRTLISYSAVALRFDEQLSLPACRYSCGSCLPDTPR